jgi:hypothetical protein
MSTNHPLPNPDNIDKTPIIVGNRPISFCEFSGIQAYFSSSCRETKFR